ncbi:MAG: Gfo/Idh/MocA family oxidoreductase [Clostridiales bacterium]|nr:Gfo/Idh/MocA family oxidoreductase [Clostridiales bacterium]
MYRVGIVGCGGIAQVHAAVLERYPDTALIACADIKSDRAKDLAGRYHCCAYETLSGMLKNEALDAVHICTPHALHVPMAKEIAEKGIMVFMEKPPIISMEQWNELIDVANRVRLGVCFQNRYNPNVIEALRIIREKVYGSPRGARAFVCWNRLAPYYQESGWRGAWETEGGGALINQSIHTLDLLIRLLGPAKKIEAFMANHHLKDVIAVEDTVEAYLQLQACPALFYATTAYAADAPVSIEIVMDSATIRLEEERLEIRTKDGVDCRTFPAAETLGKGYWGNGHYACIADFYQAAKEKRAYQNDVLSVRDTAMAMLEMYRQGKMHLNIGKKK